MKAPPFTITRWTSADNPYIVVARCLHVLLLTAFTALRVQWLEFFFIPVIPLSWKHIWFCDTCEWTDTMTKEEWKAQLQEAAESRAKIAAELEEKGNHIDVVQPLSPLPPQEPLTATGGGNGNAAAPSTLVLPTHNAGDAHPVWQRRPSISLSRRQSIESSERREDARPPHPDAVPLRSPSNSSYHSWSSERGSGSLRDRLTRSGSVEMQPEATRQPESREEHAPRRDTTLLFYTPDPPRRWALGRCDIPPNVDYRHHYGALLLDTLKIPSYVFLLIANISRFELWTSYLVLGGCSTSVAQEGDGIPRICPRCNNAAVTAAKKKEWFELCCVPIIPMSSSHVWLCSICQWESSNQPGHFEPPLVTNPPAQGRGFYPAQPPPGFQPAYNPHQPPFQPGYQPQYGPPPGQYKPS
ncbi:hypothetical protein D9619_005847 [Psilocybe cf. subviscida]|uniref:Zinc-ribbon 15 domain-containing protein n=1 Tax=Psilocybe cf. subviscida TaxID=2480587 RepID=A0A8H5FBM4_9AGAR|nr:hypothetical protein D9619_005847 [Psilocybe cf. subviscida]